MSKGPKDIDQKKYPPSSLVFSSVRMPASTTNEDGDDIRRIAEEPPEERRCPTFPTSSRQEECPLQGQQGSSSLASPLATVKQNVINIIDQVLALVILEDEGKEVESDNNEDKGHEEQSCAQAELRDNDETNHPRRSNHGNGDRRDKQSSR